MLNKSAGKGKIGIFDSGLGGLIIARALINELPQYDYVYLGDTARVPYGNRAQAEIYEFSKQAVDFFAAHGCQLVIFACNTASARALRKIQQQYLPKAHPHLKVLGVIIPTAEQAYKHKKVGVIATQSTVQSKTYVRELKKLNRNLEIIQQAAPLLVPMIESNKFANIDAVLRKYLQPLLSKKVDAIILGCTHYPLLQYHIGGIAGKTKIISQTEIIPAKLKNYLSRHKEIRAKLSRRQSREFYVTRQKKTYAQIAQRLFGKNINFKSAVIS